MSLNKLSFNIGYIFNLSLNVCWKVNMEGVIQTTSTNHFQITKWVGGIRRQPLWSSPILPKSPESSKNENDFLIILSFFFCLFFAESMKSEKSCVLSEDYCKIRILLLKKRAKELESYNAWIHTYRINGKSTTFFQ